ncbi:xeroderma pigmentosum group C-complementing protein [Exophiala viscosa]|uniref:Xeroderma pigmentosum group C-complementing protein n=1 Tax=Exophiala viscosa TaxID=2486360 RepID=A0AAN6E0X3_9EURO|nr:xeroderma pigmentosum group C-complementing protein [Exophiala viscosa]KAI1624086.1 xeroderma pigmentosum group C-complementing protein [Exophiala viscosa]
MPPFIPRKRPSASPPASFKPIKRARLADVLDAESRNIPGLKKSKTFSLGSDDSDSSLSDIDSDEFEEVSAPVKQPQLPADDDEEEEEDEDIEWEDTHKPEEPREFRPLPEGGVQLVFRKDDNEIDYGTAAAATAGKKGPTKREKETRLRAHQMHVQLLLWHNSIRNRWISDNTVQKTLVEQLPPQIRKEVEKWKRASGLIDPEIEAKKKTPKSKGRKAKTKSADPRQERDWGRPSQRLEKGKADMSNGDPLISLLKVLAAYWKKRFAITAPGLRKRGYGTKQALRQTIYSFRNDEHDQEEHGERIRNLQEFRDTAKICEGSRDVGAQLFTALLRGLGIESRLVASLQPTGFGWTKAEQQLPRKPAKAVQVDTSSEESDVEESISISEITQTKKRPGRQAASASGTRRGPSKTTIDLSSEAEESQVEADAEEDQSVVDVTPSMPKERPSKYDRDNFFPIYWTEAISPITNKVLPVSPLVLTSAVASTPEILATFEPRGAKAEKAKTVMSYVIAYSFDGTAKDVTVRYLRKRIWPGKTKGFRIPAEKIAIYNKHGKVKRYEDYDWFKRAMSGYERPHRLRTAVDDVEDASDLVPQLPEKKEVKEDVDTLQSLKASADFVLERFLRREEALRPGAKPDRMFVSGKADNLKEEPVYLRSDVERCLTAESWHKEGRRPKAGETPLKLVPVRAVTLTRKREAEEHERMTGEKQMQGLYSCDQTEYIIPPPIKDGIIPKNAYGNIDCFVPSMVPRGAVHIPLKATVRICKKLDIDFAEAVTGFEFGNKRAVPVCTGVVVAKENEKAVREAWTIYNEEQRRKEETKMEKLVLDLWRKFVMGLRIRERVQDAYGDVIDQHSTDAAGNSKDQPINLEDDVDTPGGALPFVNDDDFGGGFIVDDEEPAVPDHLELVHHDASQEANTSKGKARAVDEYPTPASISPPKGARRQQRKSLLQEAEGSPSSPLSSAASDVNSTMSGPEDDEDHGRGVSEVQQRSNVEVVVPKSQGRRANKAVSARSSSMAPSLSPELEDEDEDDEEDYKPVRTPVRKGRVNKSSKSTPQKKPSGRVSKPRSRAKAKTSAKSEMTDEDVVTPKSKRSRRRLRRDSTLVLSPYFDG